MRLFYFLGGEALPLSGQGVGKVVGVFAIFDDDLHRAINASELASAGAGDDNDVHVVGAVLHGAVVHEEEGAGEVVERAGNAFEGDVTTETFGGVASAKHFALTDGVEVAVELLVEGEATDGVVVEFEGGIDGSDFDFERACGVMDHWGFLLLASAGDSEERDEKQK